MGYRATRPRRLKNSIGRCKRCKSDIVISISGRYAIPGRFYSAVCSNPECARHTPGYFTVAVARAMAITELC